MSGKKVETLTDRRKRGGFGRFLRRFLLLVFTLALMVCGGLVLILNTVFNGPSPAARNVLTMSLIEASATKWVPALFIGEEAVEQIRNQTGAELTSEVTDTSRVVITRTPTAEQTDLWKDYPDGIKIEEYNGDYYVAYIMLVKDPAQVYLATSTTGEFSKDKPGTRINNAIETEKAAAAVNAGAFYDDGTTSAVVGSTPLGLVYSRGNCVWDYGMPPEGGFAGFDKNGVLIVAKDMQRAEAEALGIRDGCEFGPALIINGEINQAAYEKNSGMNPRTAIGQMPDGTVIFVVVDGRQGGSLGATYADLIDIMVEYGAVNACNMDGGSSSILLYRDTYGRYGSPGQVQTISNYALLQEQPRRMPDFWMIRSLTKLGEE